MKVEVAVLGAPALIVLTVSVVVPEATPNLSCSKFYCSRTLEDKSHVLLFTHGLKRKLQGAPEQELCGSRGGRPGLPGPNSPADVKQDRT